MRAISYAVAAVVAVLLFGAFGSVGTAPRPFVQMHVASMYAVLPGGTLVDVTHASSIRGAGTWE